MQVSDEQRDKANDLVSKAKRLRSEKKLDESLAALTEALQEDAGSSRSVLPPWG